jgi:hypothetical protein
VIGSFTILEKMVSEAQAKENNLTVIVDACVSDCLQKLLANFVGLFNNWDCCSSSKGVTDPPKT